MSGSGGCGEGGIGEVKMGNERDGVVGRERELGGKMGQDQ